MSTVSGHITKQIVLHLFSRGHRLFPQEPPYRPKRELRKRKGRPVHHDGRPSRNKGDAEASPADRLLADHTRELEEEERSSGLYRSEAGHPEGGGEQMTNYSRNCSLLNRRTFVRVR